MSFPHANILNVGAIGCFLSHLTIFRDTLERDYNIIWILGDDVVFSNDPTQLSYLIKKINQVDPDWDILYTDSKKGLRKLVDYFNRVYLSTPIDSELHLVPNIKEYTLVDSMTFVRTDKGSDTEYESRTQKKINNILRIFFLI